MARAVAMGAVLHVLSTCALGFAAVGMANSLAGEEMVHAAASLLLCALGAAYVWQHLRGNTSSHSHCHSHSHSLPPSLSHSLPQSHPHSHSPKPHSHSQLHGRGARAGSGAPGVGPRGNRMAVVGVLLIPTLTPCTTTLPVFLALGEASMGTVVLAVLLLLGGTLAVTGTLVALSWLGAERVRLKWVTRHERLLLGVVLIAVGVSTFLFHSHSHSHSHFHSHSHLGLSGSHAHSHSLSHSAHDSTQGAHSDSHEHVWALGAPGNGLRTQLLRAIV